MMLDFTAGAMRDGCGACARLKGLSVEAVCGADEEPVGGVEDGDPDFGGAG